jgi:SAM-dependent methyltransferase
MPLSLSAEEARRFLETDDAPAPHLDFLHTASFRVAGAAVRLGVFDALADSPASTPALAAGLGVDERGLELLLNALGSFGYVTRTDAGWANTAKAQKWLREVPGSYVTVFSFWQTVLFEHWSDLERSVRQGAPAVDFYQWLEQRPETMRQFQTMLSRLAGFLCSQVLQTVTLPAAATRLLDIGGGHATYTLAFCERYPQLSATVLDLPGALAVGAEAVAAAGLGDRVTLREGDLRTVRFDGEFDMALLFNIVHGLPPQGVRELLSGVATALRPGGTVVLLEPLSDLADGGGAVGEAFVRTFSLNLFHGQGGQVYGYRELAEWLAEAGFTDLNRHTFAASPTDHLITAVRG